MAIALDCLQGRIRGDTSVILQSYIQRAARNSVSVSYRTRVFANLFLAKSPDYPQAWRVLGSSCPKGHEDPSFNEMSQCSGSSLNRESQRKKYEPTPESVAPGLGVTARGFCLLGWTQNSSKEGTNNRNTTSGLVNNKKGSKKGAKNKDKVACRLVTSN